jgi:hypothetical protein
VKCPGITARGSQGGSTSAGDAQPGYMEQVIAAAEGWDFPESYMRELKSFAPAVARKGAAPAWKAPDGSSQSAPSVKVRPRFATPLDKGRS